MTTFATRSIEPKRTMYGSSIPSMTGPEAATQTFTLGAVLIQASGYAQIAAADPTADIIGVALEGGHNSSAAGDDTVRFAPAIPGVIFEDCLHRSLFFLSCFSCPTTTVDSH